MIHIDINNLGLCDVTASSDLFFIVKAVRHNMACNNKAKRPWVARIVGCGSAADVQREFLPVNNSPSDDVLMFFPADALQVGDVVEFRNDVRTSNKWGKRYSRYFIVREKTGAYLLMESMPSIYKAVKVAKASQSVQTAATVSLHLRTV